MSGSSDAPEIRRSQDVWYDDGNLVVRAENTLFRVYGGLIAAQSTVFADMLKMPAEPDGAQETVEGCPVVRVHDPAEDICRLLRAIHDPQYYHDASKSSFDVLECMLRLSTKYDVVYFRNRAIEQLSALYPATLDGWIKAAKARGDRKIGREKGLRTAILARTLDVPLLLPQCLYLAAMRRMDDVLDGVDLQDGRHFDIAWEDKRRCLAARMRLMREYQSKVLGYARDLMTGDDNAGCERPDICSLKATSELLRIVDANEDSHRFFVAGKTVWKQVDLCRTCRTAFIKRYDKGCQEIWDALPSYFDLGSWDDLKRPVE